jgi:hypothetical protein
MTARSLIRSRAARAGLAALFAAGALTLSACEKPAPGVSVFAGTATEHRAALCWSFDGTALSSEVCAQDVVQEALAGDGVASIPVIPGQTIGISVDPVVAAQGWTPVISTQRLVEQPITSTYFRFTFPDLQQVPEGGLPLQIVAGTGEETRGIWIFRLIPNPGVA